MDVLKFAKEKRRMCESFTNGCADCKLGDICCELGGLESNDMTDEKILKVVEKWSKKHPQKSNQTEFLKIFPNASLLDNGILAVCPYDLDNNFACVGRCDECKKEYWNKPVE